MFALGLYRLADRLLPVFAHYGLNVRWRIKAMPHGRWANICESAFWLGIVMNTAFLLTLSAAFYSDSLCYLPAFYFLSLVGAVGFIAYIPARAIYEHNEMKQHDRRPTCQLDAVGLD